MKKNNSLILIFTLILIVFGCEEIKDPAGQRDVAPIPIISNINPAIFDSKDLENSYIEFEVNLAAGIQVEKAVIEGSFNGNLQRTEIGEISTFPSTIRIYSSVAAGKIGIVLDDIHNGEVFTFELVTTYNGLTTRSSAAINVPVACAYDVNLATGSYHSVSADWASEGDITITADPADQYTLYVTGLEEMEGLVEDVGPLVMHINPIDYSVIADKSVLASDAWGFHNIAYSGNGTYSSCDGSFIMYFEITTDEANFGTNAFTFTRN